MAAEITIPTPAQMQQIGINQMAKAHHSTLVEPGHHVSAFLISHQATDKCAEAHKALESLLGLTGLELIFTGMMPTQVPDGMELRLHTDANLRMDSIPEEVE